MYDTNSSYFVTNLSHLTRSLKSVDFAEEIPLALMIGVKKHSTLGAKVSAEYSVKLERLFQLK